MEKNQIHISIDAEFHMLRHFEQISEDSLTRIKTLFTQAQIESEMLQAGSRFYPSFATDIPTILDHLFSSPFTSKNGKNGNLILSIKADCSIGELGVISINLLSQDEKEKIIFQSNRGFKLMHLKVSQLPSTCEYVVILKPQDNM